MEKPDPLAPLPEKRLESWKEIAGYLGRDVRTVQRWERAKGLPVRRLPGGEVARVWALRSELDAWWASRGIHILTEPGAAPAAGREPPRTKWVIAGMALAVAGLAALVFWRAAPRENASPLRVRPITSYVGEVLYPSFSPDGRQVVFTWNGPTRDNYDLYVRLLGGGEPARLTRDPAVETMAAWSPDGTRIAFARWPIGGSRVQLAVISALGGSERVLLDAPLTEVWPVPLLAWGRDGRWLIVGFPESSARTVLCRITVESGERKPLTAPPFGWWGDDSPVLSPDGKRLAFIRRRGPDQGNLYLLGLTGAGDLAGEPQAITREDCCVGNPLWAPGGRELLYVKNEADLATLHRIAAVPGARPRTMELMGELGTHLTISPQGDKLAYVSGEVNTDLWRVELPRAPANRAATRLEAARVYSSSRVDTMPDISPDGRRVAFVSNRSGSTEIWIAAADGSGVRPLTSLGGAEAQLPRWSPDGKQIAFNSNLEGRREILVVGAEGGKPRAITRNEGTNFVPSWSRDGKWIYFASDRSGEFQCWKAPATGGAAVQVTRHGCYGGLESADGAYLYYAKTHFASQLWRVPTGGGEETKLLPEVRSFRIAWNFAVTALGIYTVSAANPLAGFELRRYRLSDGVTEVLGSVAIPAGRSLAVSADDRWLLFSDNPARSGDLMLVEGFR